MALKGFHSGEDTRYPTFATLGTTNAWHKVANQPSRFELFGNVTSVAAGITTAAQFTGTTAYRLTTGGTTSRAVAMRRHFGTTFSEAYTSIMFKVSALGALNLFDLRTSADQLVVRIATNATGQILVYAGTGATLKATITTGWAANEWHQIRLHTKTSTNTLEIKLDGGATVDCSGTAMLDWYYLVLGTTTTINQNVEWLFDCLQVNDASGSLNNSWPGAPRIPTGLHPDSDTAITDWTRDSGTSDYSRVNELAPDLDTSYVQSTSFGDRSTYGFDNMAEPANAAIIGVCLTIVAKRADAARIIPLVSRGGTTVELAAVDVGTDYMSPIEVIIEQDPIAVGAWTQTNLNATEFGIKHETP